MQIDHEIVPLTPESAREPQIVDNPRDAARAGSDNHFVQVRILSNDGKRLRFHQISEVRLRKPALQRSKHRCREDDVTDQAQAD